MKIELVDVIDDEVFDFINNRVKVCIPFGSRKRTIVYKVNGIGEKINVAEISLYKTYLDIFYQDVMADKEVEIRIGELILSNYNNILTIEFINTKIITDLDGDDLKEFLVNLYNELEKKYVNKLKESFTEIENKKTCIIS